jgi:hypothetical protein
MTKTGWLGEDPERPAMPMTEMLLDRQQRRAGPLETALARSRADEIRAAREEEASRRDPDEYAANLVSRGYSPGLLQHLAQRLGDTTAEIEAENERIEKGQRRAKHVMRMHANGQITPGTSRAPWVMRATPTASPSSSARRQGCAHR